MNAKVVYIGRYIKLPYDVVMSQISPRALQVWTVIAAEASPEDPIAHVHQISLAKQLRCSTNTIGRAIAELVQHDLLCEAGKWQHGRCKTYRLNWNPRGAKEAPPKKANDADAQLSIPSECYIRVGPDLQHTSIERNRHCEQGEAIQIFESTRNPGLPRCARNDGNHSLQPSKAVSVSESVQTSPVQQIPIPPEPEPEPVRCELSEAELECQWIIGQIRASNEAQRRKEEFEDKKNAAFGGRGRMFLTRKSMLPPIDEPITPQNYPIMWKFLSMQWASRPDKRAA